MQMEAVAAVEGEVDDDKVGGRGQTAAPVSRIKYK